MFFIFVVVFILDTFIPFSVPVVFYYSCIRLIYFSFSLAFIYFPLISVP